MTSSYALLMQVRKLIAHGPSSLTVALPYKWVKKHKLGKGDVIHIDEDDSGLHVTAQPMERVRSITVDITGYDWPGTVSLLTTIYRRGYDEVRIRYSAAGEYQNVSSSVRLLLGFAIMENKKGSCLVKSLPTQMEQDFSTLFRRVFLILLQELDDLSEIVSDEEALKSFYHRDADLNAIVNLALRMISKGYVQDHFDELHFFHALLVLEECGDDITRFTIEVCEQKDALKLKETVMHSSKMLRLLYDSYFQKKGNIMEFYKRYYLYWPDAKKSKAPVYEHFSNQKGKGIFYLRSIVEKVIQLAEILLLEKIEE